MHKIFEYVEHKPIYVIAALFLFHILVAGLMSWLAYSPYLASYHNGEGLWKFAIDSTLYHKEALILVDALNDEKWLFWWSSYSLHLQVKWVALVYWLYGEPYPLLFEIVNSFVWVISVCLIYRATYYLFDNIKIACFSVLFLFFPSVVLSSTQLLREPFYILGLCFTIFGWVLIYQKNHSWKGSLSIVVGFYLVLSARSYVVPIMFSVFCIWILIALFYEYVERIPAASMLLVIFMMSFGNNFVNMLAPVYNQDDGFVAKKDTATLSFSLPGTITQDVKKTEIRSSAGVFLGMIEEVIYEDKKEYVLVGNRLIPFVNVTEIVEEDSRGEKVVKMNGYIRDDDSGQPIHMTLITVENSLKRPDILLYFDQKIAARLSAMRHGFRKVNENAGSAIDGDVRYKYVEELFMYLPRAIQIGFMAPFPHHWFSSGRQTGKIGRLMAGLETFIFYIVLIGFVWALFNKIKLIQPLVPILVFSGLVVVLLGYVVPNVGTIYRMRQGLLVPYFIVGIYGLSILAVYIRENISKRKGL